MIRHKTQHDLSISNKYVAMVRIQMKTLSRGVCSPAMISNQLYFQLKTVYAV